jgi:dihydrofolate reductase
MKTKIKLIVACDSEFGIGKNNDLMWHLPADMKFFKETTSGHVVIMGRKNYESIPEKFRPLPNRENVVLTRNEAYTAENCSVFSSLESCFEHFKNEEERILFVIGGGEIYKAALTIDCIDEMYITHVHHRFEADTFFPAFDEVNWEIKSLSSHEKDEKNAYSFTIKHYLRKK